MGALTSFLNFVIPGLGWVLGKLFKPPGLYLLLIACVWLYGQYEHRKGVNEVTAKYEAKAKLDAYRYAKVEAEAATQQQQVVADLNQKLDAANARAEQVRTITKEVVRYVTPKADAGCTIPAGFVRLQNLSLDPTGPVAPSDPGDADAPSGIALSTVAGITASNNAECVVRGEVISAWQEWYARNKAIHDAAQQKFLNPSQ